MASATERMMLIEIQPGTSYIDASAALGRANQRLYRQGMVYNLSVSYQGNTTPLGGNREQINVGTLPNNWAIRKAHQLALASYRKSLRDEIAAGVKPGRWHDFRVFMDGTHTTGNNVNTPFGSLGLGTGEIPFTLARKADGTDDRNFQFLGASVTGSRFGMLWELDQNADTDTNTPAGTSTQVAYNEIIGDELSDRQANQAKEDGDNPPYDPINMQNNICVPGYTLHHPAVGNQFRTPNMTVVAGLLSVVNRSDSPQFIGLHFKAGSYKGVDAEVI